MAEDVRTFEWDDEIGNDGSGEFVVLDDGDYDFTVVKFERGNYTPSERAKTPACKQAIMTIKIETPEGDCFIADKFPLASTMEWKISAFFRSIGMKKHDERIRMAWGETIGRKGRARITKTEGTEKKGVYFNNVKAYIDPPATTVNEDEEDEWS